MHRGVIEFVDALADQFVVAAAHRFFQRGDRRVNGRALLGKQACGLLGRQRLLCGGQDRFRFGARFDGLTLREILFGVLDGLLKHPLDFRVADTVAGLHFDGALLTRTRVFRADLQYAVSVDQEFYFDARQAGWGWRHFQRKTCQRTAIFGEFAFALQDVDIDAGLVVYAGSVHLLRACRNGGVARYDFGDRPAVGFDAERQRCHIQKKHVAYAMVQNVGLHGRAKRHNLIGIQLRVRLAVEVFLHRAANQRRARCAAYQNDFLNFAGLQLRVRERLPDWAHGAIDDRANQRFKSAPLEFLHIDGAVRKRKAQCGGFAFGKLMFDGDQVFAQFLREFRVRRKIDAMLLENFLVHKSLKQVIDVVTAQVRVAVGGEHLVDIAFVGGDEL